MEIKMNRCRKKEFITRDTGTRKYGCPFKLRYKPVVGGEGQMVKIFRLMIMNIRVITTLSNEDNDEGD